MHKLNRDPRRLETLELYTLLGNGKVTYSPDSSDSFLKEIGAGLQEVLGSRSTLHGFRAQNLFESMIVSMGKLRLVKKEDSGGAYIDEDKIHIPDFRIVTVEGANYLVEVKNYYQRDPRDPFQFRIADLEKLKNYASMVGTPLKIAIYWVQWSLWTLNDPDDFEPNGTISFPEAMRLSEMALVGDYIIMTEFPLQLILSVDKTKPREEVEDGFTMTLSGGEFRTAGRVIEEAREKGLAFFFMVNGIWHVDEDGRVDVDEGGLPTSVTFTFAPLAPPDQESNQPFASIGNLSQLFTNYFNRMTLDGESITDLGRDKTLNVLASLIPEDYKGRALRLWRFIQKKGENKREKKP